MIKCRLYSRPGCHLCDVMLQELGSIDQKNKISIEIVNIDNDPVIYQKYAMRIPVLTLSENDRVICEQFLDRKIIEQILGPGTED